MKMIVFVALAIVAVSAVEKEHPKILRSEYNQQPEGSYVYGFETEDGIKQQESGALKDTVDEDKKPVTVLTKSGSWSYTNPDGKVETITYIADELGFQPEGDSIPKAPVVRR